MADSLVSVVITTLNRQDKLLACLNSFYKSTYPLCEVIVVDNGSTDGTQDAVMKNFPEARLVRLGANRGIAGGRNVGLKEARGEYVFFLDSDTVMDPDCVKEAMAVMESSDDIGIVGPKIYYYDAPNMLYFAGAGINLITSQVTQRGSGEEDKGQYDNITETSHVPTGFMVRKDVADPIDGHDEIFFMSYADTDFAFRVRKNGFKVLYTPRAKLWHQVAFKNHQKTLRDTMGFTLPLRSYYFARNRVIFMKRHASPFAFVIFLTIFYPAMNLYYAYKIIRLDGTPEIMKMHWFGVLDGVNYLLTGKAENRRT